MNQHNGMRPHDIAILMKVFTKRNEKWFMKDLAKELDISSSEVSQSLARSRWAGLLSADKQHVHLQRMEAFLEHGLPYVFPAKPGRMVRGVATAYSAKPLSKYIRSQETVVWPYAYGDQRGQAIEPLHANTPQACLQDTTYYALMALVDGFRIGKTRETALTAECLKAIFYG